MGMDLLAALSLMQDLKMRLCSPNVAYFATCVHKSTHDLSTIWLHANTEANVKLSQLTASYGSDRKVYTSVEEFMADRQMLIDLVVARRQNLQVTRQHALIFPPA